MTRLSALAVRQPSLSAFPSLVPVEKVNAMNNVILAFGEEIPTYCPEEVSGFALLFTFNGLPEWAMNNIHECYGQAKSLARLSKTPEWMAHSPMAPAYTEFSRWGGPHLAAAADAAASPPDKLLLALVVDRVEDRVRPELMEFLNYCQDRALLAKRAGVPEEEFSLPLSQWQAFRRARMAPSRLASFRANGSYLPHQVLSSRFQIR